MQPSDPTFNSPTTLTVAEAEGYLQRARDTQPLFSSGVALLCSAAIPQFLGVSLVQGLGASVRISTVVGSILTTLMIIAGVTLLMVGTQRLYRFDALATTHRFTTEAVCAVVEDWRRTYRQRKTLALGMSLALFALSPIPLLVVHRTVSPHDVVWAQPLLIALLLLIVAGAAALLVWSLSTYFPERVLLQEREYDPRLQRERRSLHIGTGVYWTLAVIIAIILIATQVMESSQAMGIYVLAAMTLFLVIRTSVLTWMVRRLQQEEATPAQ